MSTDNGEVAMAVQTKAKAKKGKGTKGPKEQAASEVRARNAKGGESKEVAPEAKAEVVKPLTQRESERLEACESVIQKGKDTVVEVAKALAEIRDKRLYRTTHSDFESYARANLGMTRQRVSQLIQASQTFLALAGPAPDQEGIEVKLTIEQPSTRALAEIRRAGLSAAEQVKVWKRAQKLAKDDDKPTPTSKHVAAAVAEFREKHPAPAADGAPQAVPARPTVGAEVPEDAEAKAADATPAQTLDDDALPDLDWAEKYLGDKLKALPEPQRKILLADAILWRNVNRTPEMKTIVSQVSRLAKAERANLGRGHYFVALTRFLGLPHPGQWIVCNACDAMHNPPDNGSCGECASTGYHLG
jgi:hypothetical protein